MRLRFFSLTGKFPENKRLTFDVSRLTFHVSRITFYCLFFSSSSNSTRRRILPTMVLGSSVRNSTNLGTL